MAPHILRRNINGAARNHKFVMLLDNLPEESAASIISGQWYRQIWSAVLSPPCG